MKVVHYLRKKDNFMWSIEKLFSDIRKNLPSYVNVNIVEMPYLSQGFFKRVVNIFYSFKNQGEVNHITGDINYIALGLKKKKTLLTIHDLGYMNQYKFLSRFLLWLFWIYIPVRRVRYVVAISSTTRNEILRYAKCKPDKIRIIPDFISPNFKFSPQPFNETKPVILQIGTKFNKNIERLIAALEGISCQLVIVGELQKHHSELLKKHGVECVNYSGLTEEEIVALYKNCDIVSFCSLLEGFGLPILEGQATGRPVVTSNLSSMPEVAGDSACLTDPYNPAAIRESILKVIQDRTYREELIVKGLENVKRFSVSSVAEQYAKLYQEIAQH